LLAIYVVVTDLKSAQHSKNKCFIDSLEEMQCWATPEVVQQKNCSAFGAI